jgi:hypothetical protein
VQPCPGTPSDVLRFAAMAMAGFAALVVLVVFAPIFILIGWFWQ